MEYELTVEDKKWNKMWDLWSNGEASSPYAQIMEYSAEVNNGGHAQYFSNLGDLNLLEDSIQVLLANLPELFTKKLEKAYKLYLKDEFARKTEKIMNKCDDIFYKNEEVINDMLKEYASTLDL